MDDKFLIHVEIAGKSYGIRINRSEEKVAREAVRQIRKKMDQYRKKYSDVDVKDLLAMVTFQLSVENLKLEDKKFIVHRLYSFNSAMHLSTSRTNFDNLILALFISPSLTETTRAVSMLSHLAFNSSIVFISC